MKLMVDDPDKWIRATLGYVLSIVEHSDSLSLIIELLKDDDSDVRKNASLALSAKAKDAQNKAITGNAFRFYTICKIAGCYSIREIEGFSSFALAN